MLKDFSYLTLVTNMSARFSKSFIDIDFETRSETDFAAGTYKYAAHPSTEILMISFSFDQEEIFNWNPFFPTAKSARMLKKAIAMVKSGKAVFRAFNAEFEFWNWNINGPKQFDWPKLPEECFYDAMVAGCIAGLPAKLEHAAEVIAGGAQKNKEGAALINFFSKPSRRKGGELFNNPIDYKEKFMSFVGYCDDDVRAQISVCEFCPDMTQYQYDIYLLTEKMNSRGLPIYKAMAEGALKLVDRYKAEAELRIQKITKGKIQSATQNKFLLIWLNENGCDIPNLTAPIIEKYLRKTTLTPIQREVISIRSNVSKTSTAKFKSAIDYLSAQNTVHGFLKAFIAITGRWGGRGIQIQNFSKPDKDFPYWCDFELLSDLIAGEYYEFLTVIYGDIMQVLKAATRSMIKAHKGKKFVCADFAQIEARIVMWLAGDKVGLGDFAGEGKIYENMAGTIFNKATADIMKPSFERDVGKEAVLGCGFGMGAAKFVFRCVEQRNLPVTSEVGTKAVKGYRKRYVEVVKEWKQCEIAAVKAIQTPGATFSACKGKLKYKVEGNHLTCQLSSGRKLLYAFPRVRNEENAYGNTVPVIYYKHWDIKAPAGKKWCYTTIWGGTLFQHAVQATAMDVMANGMLNAEEEGYPALFTVHDESLAMVDENFGSYKEYENILCRLPSWAKGLPIVAEGWEGPIYKK